MRTKLKALPYIFLALTAFAVDAVAIQVQVQSYTSNQLFACDNVGCGGIFTGMIGGTKSNNNLVGGSVVPLMCIDYQNDTNIPSVVYDANISTITDGSSVSNLRFGAPPNPGSWTFKTTSINYGSNQTLNLGSDNSTANLGNVLERYQMIAYLASHYNTAGASNDDLQRAIWSINATTGTTPSFSSPTAGSNTWLSSAAQWLVTSDSSSRNALLANFRVVSNVGIAFAGPYPAQIQEFLTVVPEPAHYAALLAIGLGLLFWLPRRMAFKQ